MNNVLHFREATFADVEALNRLVNQAYRGDTSRQGWTTEADLLDGQRTDPEFLAENLRRPDSVILLVEQGPQSHRSLIGSVQLEKKDSETCYFGMFTVHPSLQGQGLGKQIMAAAEQWARQKWQAKFMEMTVITLRKELISFYERRGYQFTQEIRPFHADPRFGIQKQSGIELGVWRKRL
jgi:GNAT superfamily N-acetyltransferase